MNNPMKNEKKKNSEKYIYVVNRLRSVFYDQINYPRGLRWYSHDAEGKLGEKKEKLNNKKSKIKE